MRTCKISDMMFGLYETSWCSVFVVLLSGFGFGSFLVYHLGLHHLNVTADPIPYYLVKVVFGYGQFYLGLLAI